MGRSRLAIVMSLAAALLLTCGPVSADAATAEELFRVARRLLAGGQIAEACASFEESQRLDPSSGTLLSLADCHARLGRTASAWAEFLEAERLSLAQKRPDRAREARAQAKALEPELSRLQIRVRDPAPGLAVERNGKPLALSSLNVSLPVDPGRYTVRVTASGYVPWTQTLDVQEPGEQVVDVPPLVREPITGARAAPQTPQAKVAPRRPPEPRRKPRRVSRTAQADGPSLPAGFWVASGTGIAATGLAAVFGGLSVASYGAAEDSCPGHRDCSSSALDDWDRASTQARIANISAAMAIVAAGTAAYFYFDSRSKRPARAAASSSVRP